MREIDNNGLNLCNIQANIFAHSLEHANCSSAIFVRRFMLSDFAKRMDGDSFLYGMSNENDAYIEIEKEFGQSSYGSIKYTHNELFWMGYLYRYWCYTFQTESKKVYKIISPRELQKLYFPYHSLDPKSAIARILEAKGLDNKNLTKQGIEILRQLKKENK